MKRILITGKNSYIGNSLERWLMQESDNYKVNKISLREKSWQEKDFGIYDVVFHAAGIAHIKETKKNQQLYFEVNRDLAFEVAYKAKKDGVKHFIFLSSMSVYGLETGVIDQNTPLRPKNAYGKSKLEAETLIESLSDNSFKVSIIRPPMIYGKGCKGNYQKLATLALKTPVFPLVNNKRSMIHVDNLSEFVKQLIDNQDSGVFCPQNEKYVNTSEMVHLISEVNRKKIKLTKTFNPLIKKIQISTLNKVFRDLYYDESIVNRINHVSFEESIIITEKSGNL